MKRVANFILFTNESVTKVTCDPLSNNTRASIGFFPATTTFTTVGNKTTLPGEADNIQDDDGGSSVGAFSIFSDSFKLAAFFSGSLCTKTL